MTNSSKAIGTADDLAKPLVVPPDAYISRAYAEAEQERLFRKVWLQAGRVEDLPDVGDFITYDIGPDSVIIVRSGAADGTHGLSAYHNVCPHRGRRLVDTPPGKRNAVGTRKSFICGYHGWAFGLDDKPQIKNLIAMAHHWSPHRSTAALLFWRYYRAVRNKEGLLV